MAEYSVNVMLNPLITSSRLTEDPDSVIKSCLLFGLKEKFVKPSNLRFLYIQSEEVIDSKFFSRMKKQKVEKVSFKKGKLSRNGRAMSVKVGDEFLKFKKRDNGKSISVTPMILLFDDNGDTFRETYIGSAKANVTFTRDFKHFENQLNCRSCLRKLMFTVYYTVDHEHKVHITKTDTVDDYDTFVRAEPQKKSETNDTKQFADFEISKTAAVQYNFTEVIVGDIIKVIANSGIVDKDARIMRIFYNYNLPLTDEFFIFFVNHNETVLKADQMELPDQQWIQGRFESSGSVLVQQPSGEYVTVSTGGDEDEPLIASMVINVLCKNGENAELIVDLDRHKFVRLERGMIDVGENVQNCFPFHFTDSDGHNNIEFRNVGVEQRINEKTQTKSSLQHIRPFNFNVEDDEKDDANMSSRDASPSNNDVPRGSRSPSPIQSSKSSSSSSSSRRRVVLRRRVVSSSSRSSRSRSRDSPRKSSRTSSSESSLPSTRPSSPLMSHPSPRAPSPVKQQVSTSQNLVGNTIQKMNIPEALEKTLNPPEPVKVVKDKKHASKKGTKRAEPMADEVPFPQEVPIDNPLQEKDYVLTPSSIQKLDIRGALFRGIKASVIEKLNNRLISELFDKNQAGVPLLFVKSHNDFSTCVMIEGTHRFSSIRSRLLSQSDKDIAIQVMIVVVLESEYEALWEIARSITYVPGVDSREKANFETLPARVVRYLRDTFTNEAMRTRGAYDDYTKALNQYEFLCTRFDDNYRTVLRSNSRYHHLVVKMLFDAKLITKESQAESELSGFYAFLMASEVRQPFFDGFDEMPALNKAHSLIYRASKNHQETVLAWMKDRTGPNNRLFPKSLMLRKLQQLLKQDDSSNVVTPNTIENEDANMSDVNDERAGPTKAKKVKKLESGQKQDTVPTTGSGLQVLRDVSQIPANSLLVVGKQVPSVSQLVGKGVSVVVIDPLETASTFQDMCRIAESSSVLRCGEYYKKNFVAAGPLIKAAKQESRLSASTLQTLLVKLTDSENSRARTPKMQCFTVLDFQPTC